MAKTKNASHFVELTDEEIKHILEALIFSSTVDVCANWEEVDNNKMLDIALKIKQYVPKVKLSKKRVDIEKDMLHEDKERVKIIQKEFKI